MSVINSATAGWIRTHLQVVFAVMDLDEPWIRDDLPDCVGESEFSRMIEKGIVVHADNHKVQPPDRDHFSGNRNPLWRWKIPGDLREHIRQTWERPENRRHLCSECYGTGFSNTGDGYECQRCGNPVSREAIDAYLGGESA